MPAKNDANMQPEAEIRILRSVGFGMPDVVRALQSTDNRAVLYAEEKIAPDKLHLYELFLPNEFLEGNSRRCIKITLAYNPPLNGRRKEYLSRTMQAELFRDLPKQTILQARSAIPGQNKAVKFPTSKYAEMRPTKTAVQWSTVQSCCFYGKQETVFDQRTEEQKEDKEPVLWHVLVSCAHRFGTILEEVQDYALVVSLEHSDENVRIYQPLRNRVTIRARQNWQ